MAQRTQMRLHAITGSLSSINSGIADANVTPVGSSDAFAGNMLEAMGHIAGAIKRIHGNSDFLAEDRGVFTHATSQFIGILSASSDLKAGGALDIAGGANLRGAVHAFNTLDVDSLATMSGSVVEDLAGGDGAVLFADASGRLKSDAKLTWDGTKLSVDGALDLTGGIVGSSLVAGRVVYVDAEGALTTESGLDYDAAANVLGVSGSLDVSGSSDLHGAVQMYSTLNVDALATVSGSVIEDLNNGRVALVGSGGRLVDDAQITHSAGQLTVSGSTFSKDVSIARNLTVAGDLLVQGDTVTINVGEIVAEDKHIVLAKVDGNISDTTADRGGLILTGSTNHTILWVKDDVNGHAWEFSENLVPAGTKDLGLTGDRWQNLWLSANADIDGNADVAGTLAVTHAATFASVVTASAGIMITGDTATRLYIVDADGSMKDEADLTYSSGKLLVNGASGLEVTNAAVMKSTLEVDGIAHLDANVYAAQNLYLSGAADFASTLAVADDVTLDKAADQSILKTGGDLHMSASADLRLQAGGDVKLVDQYRAASTWSGVEGIQLAASAAEWSNFKATFGGEVSLLAALTGGGSGGKFKAEIAATSAFVTSSAMADVAGGADFASKWSSIVEPKIAKVDVFVNGQLMVSGSGMDYDVASNGDITFGFDLVADDIVMALVR